MAIQDDKTLVNKGDLKNLYTNKIAPYLGANLMLSTNNSDYYSTDEKVIGIWIDGKPIYQKTIKLTNPIWSGTDHQDTVHSYTSIGASVDNVIDINNIMVLKTNNDSFYIFKQYIVAGVASMTSSVRPTDMLRIVSLNNSHSLHANTIDLIVNCQDYADIYDYYSTIQYTKTTDTATSALTTPGAYDINFPNTWKENTEIYFGNGVYGYRATGTANVTANTRWSRMLVSNTPNLKMISYGGNISCPHPTTGTWECPVPWFYEQPHGTLVIETAIFGGSTTVSNRKDLAFYINYADDASLPYDIWVTYTK